MAEPFYRYSLKTAKSSGNESLYYQSKAENIRCREYMENPFTGFHARGYVDNCVDSDRTYTKDLIDKFGLERVMSIYAATLKGSINDPRISPEIREWAKSFNAGLRNNEDISDMRLNGFHIGVVNILARHAKEEYDKLNLFTYEHCRGITGEDLEGKVIVIGPKSLKEEYWSQENQLWLATGGFGCDPNASGRAVYATCLIDGDENRWDRGNVVGIIKDEYLPEWAREKLEQIMNPVEEHGLEMN